jgi:hypothetical protein
MFDVYLPDGLSQRRLRVEDASAVTAVMAAVELSDLGVVVMEEADLVGDWQRPSFDVGASVIGMPPSAPGPKGDALRVQGGEAEAQRALSRSVEPLAPRTARAALTSAATPSTTVAIAVQMPICCQSIAATRRGVESPST